MDRLACVDLPAFPLQLLLKRRADWRGQPVAVVEADRPQAAILWVSDEARALGVRTGQKYAAALTLVRNLRAEVVPEEEVNRGVKALTERLRRHTPSVEPAKGRPGVFWLDGKGLGQIYPSLGAWAEGIEKSLAKAKFRAAVVVGFTRFGTYALAKSGAGVTVLAAEDEERAGARRVCLERLDLEPSWRDPLAQLGVYTVGDLLRLPAGGLLERFGAEVHQLRRFAAGDLFQPFQPISAEEPLRREEILDDPESDLERLCFRIKRLLNALLSELERRSQAAAGLTLRLRLDRAGDCREEIRPAVPTLDARQLMGLLQLRLQSVRLASGVCELSLSAHGIRATAEQLRLFRESRRDLSAAGRAFARLRARWGEQVVVRARLMEAHLPEASFAWEPISALASAHPQSRGVRVLVRRIYEKPLPLPKGATCIRGALEVRASVERSGSEGAVHGPYIVCGGWWRRMVHREYYFAEPSTKERVWLFYDRVRGAWFIQGRVE